MKYEAAKRNFLWNFLILLLMSTDALAYSPKILVISSYHHDFEWTHNILNGLTEEVQTFAPTSELYYEFMDARQFDVSKTTLAFKTLLATKYDDRSLDVLVAADNVALDFIIRNKSEMFSELPVVFAGINHFDPVQLQDYPEIVGVKEELDIERTINLLHQIHPEVKSLVVVTDSSTSGKMVMKEVEILSKSLSTPLQYEFFTDWSWGELQKRLQTLSANEAVLAIALFNDRLKHYKPAKRSIPWVREQTNQPIYTMWARDVKLGFNGGVVISGYETGQSAGRLVGQVLANSVDENISGRFLSSPNVTMLNHVQLKAMKVASKNIPDDSIIVNAQVSFYERYHHWIWGGAMAILFQTILCVFLILNMRVRRQFQLQLEHRANYDTLTGLPNRATFDRRLSIACNKALVREAKLYILFADLNDFKRINDSHGHYWGDLVLKATAQRLREALPVKAEIARLSGDEFAIFIYRPKSGAAQLHNWNIQTLLNRLLSVFEHPWDIELKKITVTASIGAACYPTDTQNVEELMQHADSAMYQAKHARSTRSASCIYTREVGLVIRRRALIESGLRHALENKEFSVHYQPIVSRTGYISGCEALLRWQNETLGTIAPNEFIPIAEQSGWIIPIGEWVLRTACEQLAELSSQGFNVRMSVNISYQQFLNQGILDSLTKILQQQSVPTQQLCLEITERVLVESNPNTVMIIQRIQAMGIKIAIDDFGVGYSSLSYLTKYPFDIMKLDSSFVDTICADNQQLDLVRGIKSIADALSISTTVEGVEDNEQWQVLKGMGFTDFQGFLFFKPVSAKNLFRLLSTS